MGFYREIRGSAVRLRDFRDEEVDAVAAYRSDKEVMRFTPYEGCSREQAQEFIAGQKEVWAKNPDLSQVLKFERPVMFFAIEDLAQGVFAGECLIMPKSLHQAEIGYALAPESRGRGLAGEAIRLLLSCCFRDMSLHRVAARVSPENGASIHLIEQCGFRREGTFLKDYYKGGVWHDTLYYALLAEEWKAQD